MEFEWDPRKAAANLKKHGVGFDEAADAFFDENAVELFDDSNSEEELRYQLVGLSSTRLLFVVFTVRAEIVRIISARKANARQIEFYNEQKG